MAIEKDYQLSCRFSQYQMRKLRELAKQMECPLSSVIRQAINAFIRSKK